MALRDDAEYIIKNSIKAVLPDEAVIRALSGFFGGNGKTIVVAAGKAAWQMASAAQKVLPQIDRGIVITKYGHVKEAISGVECFEAGHPVPDENSFSATKRALELVKDLTQEDTVVFLLSGGGSALFELPLIPGKELQDITKQLLASGADIVEINTIRKRLSRVKGGRFAQVCAPAKVFSVVLSDIVGDPLDMIASGPAYPDSSSCADAKAVVEKYGIRLSEEAKTLLDIETPKALDNVETHITGSVKELCRAAARSCQELGYKAQILTTELTCEAKEAGSYLADVAMNHESEAGKLAFIAGGETVVHLTGDGKGGRNQELALSAAIGIAGQERDIAIFSVGSDGTDGPTDAAGGYVDTDTVARLEDKGIDIKEVLANNDSYNALKEIDGLIVTGPTGTNVNDVAVVLLDG
ncbi:MAG: glycerate kinase [Butyrivibrio sp.]|nr:glycerate kinase [Butyrivibrio sp.]MBP3280004.1 glycerate kinase [Butyrivibrio sp.]